MRRTNRKQRLYVYTSGGENGKKYFHDPITNKVMWEPPSNAILIDPITKQEIQINKSTEQNQPANDEPKRERPDQILLQNMKRLPRISQTLENMGRSMTVMGRHRMSRKSSLMVTLNGGVGTQAGSNLASGPAIPIYLPQDISKDSKTYDIRKFAAENFNTRTKGSIFNKKEIPPDELLVFDTDSSVLPLLKSTPSNLKKKCEEIFHLIIEYTKYNPKAQPSVFVEMINKERNLINEIYIILMKLIRNNPSEDDTKMVWDIILTICTFF